jgi:hypothetical protein
MMPGADQARRVASSTRLRPVGRVRPNVDVEGAALERRHPHLAEEHLAAGPMDGGPGQPTMPKVAADG